MADPSRSADTNDRAPVGRPAIVAGALGAFVGTFLFRFLTIDFLNDHFLHLSRGRQILLGDVPIRDFFDPGLIAQYYASAAALAWSGQNLYGEALVTVSFIAAGAAVTFVVSARLSRSAWLPTAATVIVVLSTPRLYGYPKVFFYVAALLAAWRFAQRPGRGNLVALAAITVLAFLFRHDHGVYIGLSVIGLLTIQFWPRHRSAAAALGGYLAACLVMLLPFLVFVQSTVGLVRYVGGIAPQMQHVATVSLNRLPVTVDLSAPLMTIAPAAERRVNVRWADGLDDATRSAHAARHGLTRPVLVEDTTWSYVLEDERPVNIRDLVNEPAVVDTHGIDRPGSRLDIDEPLYVRVQRWIPLFRMHLAPGVFTRANALAWFYYMTLVVPYLGAGTLAVLLWRGRIGRAEAAVAGMAALLCVIVIQTLVRGSPDSRLADVAAPVAVVGAWVTGRWLRPWTGAMPVRHPWRTATACLFFVVSIWSVGTDAYAGTRLVVSGMLTGPAGISWRWNLVTDRLQARPIENWGRTDPGVAGLGRYVFECTKPGDRVLITWFQPEIFFYAERGFAGGQTYLQPRWHASEADQRLTVERLERQRVPLVLVTERRDYGEYFPIVRDYVQQHYATSQVTAPGLEQYAVLTDRRLKPTGTYEPLGLPCYR